ncbi:DNA-binding protein [Diplogelasinospora grovesii]|uniref:DNA-binding protein n=1 Tax=Diplogelasinospora grovesii TaxID=303347 RepID=A0AAN6S842_9PEZI|nr:DNA-binding protein [Diplogelasinospora grovesii]
MAEGQAETDTIDTKLEDAHTLLSTFNTFLVVSIHNILFYRGIYPPTTFISSKAYNLPVHQNRHPKVCSWVQDAVNAVAIQLSSGQVSRIAVVIHAPLHPPPLPPLQPPSSDSIQFPQSSGPSPPSQPTVPLQPYPIPPSSDPPSSFRFPQPAQPSQPEASLSSQPQPNAFPFSFPSSSDFSSSRAIESIKPGSVLEKWVFDVQAFPAWPGGPENFRRFAKYMSKQRPEQLPKELDPLTGQVLRKNQSSRSKNGKINWIDVNEHLRGALWKMAQAAEKLPPVPQGCTFTVAVEIKEEGKAPIGHPQPWIPAEVEPPSPAEAPVSGLKTTPIRSVTAGPMFFECWVEEGPEKLAFTEKKKARDT